MNYNDPMAWWILAAILPSFFYGMALNATYGHLKAHEYVGKKWSRAILTFFLPVIFCLVWSAAMFRKAFDAAGLTLDGRPIPSLISPQMAVLAMMLGILISWGLKKKKPA